MKLKEIAKAANVSPSAVSLVMKNKPGVGPEKRRQILQLLEENGYSVDGVTGERPKAFRFIKYYRHSNMVNGNPGFVNRIIEALERECRDRKIDFLVTTVNAVISGNDYVAELLENETSDGIIFLGTELRQSDAESILSHAKKPLVVVDNPMIGLNYSAVTMDNDSAIKNSVNYLYNMGHRRIGFLANAFPGGNCILRRKAYETAILELGLPIMPELIYEVTPSNETACDDISSMLDRGIQFPTALVANNDCIALGAMRAFRQHGISVPDDISVIGFDGIDYSAVSDPPLSTHKVSCRTMGIMAVQMLLLRHQHHSLPSMKTSISTVPIIRNSIGPCRNVNAKF